MRNVPPEAPVNGYWYTEGELEAVGRLARVQRKHKAHEERLWRMTEVEDSGETYVVSYKFAINTYVWKPKGYPFEGTVVAHFETLSSEQRYVVESRLSPGLLHIFNGDQLEEV